MVERQRWTRGLVVLCHLAEQLQEAGWALRVLDTGPRLTYGAREVGLSKFSGGIPRTGHLQCQGGAARAGTILAGTPG